MKNFKLPNNEKLAVIMVGLPGSGKGTQSEFIINLLKLDYISSGAVTRKYSKKNDKLGKEMKKRMLAGKPQPDEMIIKAVDKEISGLKAKNGILFDNFPFTLKQASALNKFLKKRGIAKQMTFFLNVDPKNIIDRIEKRMICTKCGKIYMISKDKQENAKCSCGTKLIKRQDDNPKTAKKRISIYLPRVKRLVKFYKKQDKDKKFFEIDGNLAVLKINKAILEKVDDYYKNA